MRTSLKILLIWGGIMLAYLASFELLSHRPVDLPGLLTQTIFSLLFVISFFVYLREPIKYNKIVFLNFTIFFAVSSFFAHLYYFVGVSFLTEYKYAAILYYQYFSAAYILTISMAVIYLVVDLMFRDFRILKKYILSLTITLVFFGWYFYPMIKDPMHLYTTEEIHQWKTLASVIPPSGRIPTPEELSQMVTLQSWKNNVPTGNLYPEEELRRIEELYLYLDSNNYIVLLMRPLWANLISMNVLLIAFILLFFGYIYKKDPPQGAYVDKIMFCFLLFIATEIIHYWGYMMSIEMRSYQALFALGQYFSLPILFFIVLFFILRLRFITSAHGEFYETEIATNPQLISRWRDWLDNVIIARFANLKFFNSRLFEQTPIKK